MRLGAQLGILVAAFAGGSLAAHLGGAPNLGTALTFGQLSFAVALVAVLLFR